MGRETGMEGRTNNSGQREGRPAGRTAECRWARDKKYTELNPRSSSSNDKVPMHVV
jgi:hypothetical protein